MRLMDADNHYYETRESFTRHIAPSMRAHAIRAVRGDDGVERIVVGKDTFRYLPMDFDAVPVPGRQDLRTAPRPEWLARDARLAVMDAQDIDSAILLPTIALFVEHSLRDDPDALYANLSAFNRWVLDEWGFGAQGRIYAAPLISLRDRDRAIAETEWALAQGARVLAIRPGHAYGRSPADPHFDPLWARIQEARAMVALHVSDSGYRELYAGPWGLPESHSVDDQAALQWVTCFSERPVFDTLAALVLGNVFQRFPGLNVLSLENGTAWVPYLLNQCDRVYLNGPPSTWIGGPPRETPSELLRRHLYVSPFFSEDVVSVAQALGVSQILHGSDYPHGEGRADPQEGAAAFAELGEAATQAIMHDNMQRLFGL